MVDFPAGFDPRDVGLHPAEVTAAALLHQRHGHVLYRLSCGPRSFVLKWFADDREATEVRAYALLERLDVPTIPVNGRTNCALLLEDLATSASWRLGTVDDMQRAVVGSAVAGWYRRLHAAGGEFLARVDPVPGFLRREQDALDAEAVLHVSERLGLAGAAVWELVAESIGELKAAIRSLPATLTYNDFHWTNLALSRAETPDLRAVVFDYHLLGIATRYSDYRNATGVLRGPATGSRP